MKSILYIADFRSNNNAGVCTGHFFSVAENYQKIFDDVCEVKVAGGPIYVGHFKEEDLFLLPCDGICGESKIKNLISTIRNAWRLFRKVTPNDVVVIQQSVPAMLLFSLLFTYFGSSNVYMIQYNDEPMSRLYFKIMMFLAGNRIKGIICPNDKVGKAYKRPYIVVPDYIYTKKQNEAIIPFSQKNFDFCVVGRLNNDKGIIEVINFFKDKSYSLLIAGKPENDAFKEKILKAAENAPNVKLQLGYVSEQDYKSILLQSRFCLLNYCGDYANRSSGVVLDTIFQGVPVVGRECKALQFVRDYDVGFLYKEISSFNPGDVMNEDLYEKFKLNITHYQKENKKNKELLQSFLRL